MARKDIFAARRHRLLRKRVPGGERLGTVLVGVALAGTVAWVIAQRDSYDPSSRDLAPELLSRDGPKIQLYNQPLKPWVEPGTTVAGVAPVQLGPFPASLTADGWALDGRVRAFDTANLYEKINGEAEKFIKQGFRSLHYAVLRNPGDGTELAIELYDQGGLGGSLGIFAEHVPAERSVEEREGVSYFLTSVGVIGRMGPYFFRAAADRSGALVRDKSLALVAALAELVGGRAAVAAAAAPQTPAATPDLPPEVVLLTETLEVGESRIAFQAENVFQFDFARSFWFGALDGEARAFVHRASGGGDAAELFSALMGELRYDYEVVAESERSAVLQHRFLKTWFAVERRGEWLVGIDNADSDDAAREVTDRLAEAAVDE